MLLPEFQGHLVRRMPTAEELNRRPSCSITPRDLDILVAAGVHGLLTADLVGLAFFPPDRADPRHASSRAYVRLQRCWLWGYLDRYVLPAPRGTHGGVPDLFALGSEGLRLVLRRDVRAVAPAKRRVDELDVHFVHHELTVATLWAHLQALVRTGRLRSCRWTPERAWRAADLRFPDASGGSLRVLPDGYAELGYVDGTVRGCAVEIDRCTLSGERFRRKLRAWERYVSGGQLARDRGHQDSSFVVVTASWERLRELWKAGRQDIPEEDWGRYLFGTTEVLSPERFAMEAAWLSLDGEYRPLLAGLLPGAGMIEKGN